MHHYPRSGQRDILMPDAARAADETAEYVQFAVVHSPDDAVEVAYVASNIEVGVHVPDPGLDPIAWYL